MYEKGRKKSRECVGDVEKGEEVKEGWREDEWKKQKKWVRKRV
jgi:hypothetical protein